MAPRYLRMLTLVLVAMVAGTVPTSLNAAPPALGALSWTTVVNNNDVMPGSGRWVDGTWTEKTFNSYNQPSVNATGLVVIRARSKGGEGGGSGSGGTGGEGGNQPTHGIYTRDMSVSDSPIIRILDRKSNVPAPNNIQYPPDSGKYTTFVETPSFPRIDIWSDTIATRGNHQPVYKYMLSDGTETRVGTTGIYANPFGGLVTAASKLGAVSGFDFFEVPGADPWTAFDVFPGAPSVTNGKTIVFKGNYTVGGQGKTGAFYRILEGDADYGGTSPVMLIANSTDTLIPGTRTLFGSISPPSAAGQLAVFAGFDNEQNPTLGGLYMVDLRKPRTLKRLIGIAAKVPGGARKDTFNRLGEAVAFDGRYVGFWGAWGTETRTVRLYCPTEGNKDRQAYCKRELYCYDQFGNAVLDANGIPVKEEDPNSICSGSGSQKVCYQAKEVPVHQGIFLYDTIAQTPWLVTKTGDAFDDFVSWNYSGKPPCTGMMGHGQEGAEDDGEPARWRSSSFVAVSDGSAAFKASAVDRSGIYLSICRNPATCSISTVLDTTMGGKGLDADAPAGSKITEVSLERESLRANWLAINARMGVEGGTEEDGMAGVYVTRVPTTPPR